MIPLLTNISQKEKRRDYFTKDERSAMLFALHFKGKLTKTPHGNFLITI